jgi:2-polyprenyl-3-methyl-5-hydroxy-6-metoxy-1,4-benzoquinol methylase
MRSLRTRALEDEQMDAADLDSATYATILTHLAQVNRVTLSARPTRAFLRRALQGRTRFRLLDVGFGKGDLLRGIAAWARRRNLAAELVGIDLNPKSAVIAQTATPAGTGISYRTGDYADLAEEGWDFVVSSLVAHHMTRDQLVAFLRFMERESRLGWHVNDLHRHRFAYLGFPLLARAMRWHRIVREDGTLSIARSYRPGEWPALLAEAGVAGACVERRFPFRLCVERIR